MPQAKKKPKSVAKEGNPIAQRLGETAFILTILLAIYLLAFVAMDTVSSIVVYYMKNYLLRGSESRQIAVRGMPLGLFKSERTHTLTPNDDASTTFNTEETFSGLFWTGEESVAIGLADALGSSSYVAREVIGAEDIVDFSAKEDIVERLAKRFGAGAASSLSRIWGGDGPQIR